MAKTAVKAPEKPAANVTPSDVPLMPWDTATSKSEVDIPESLLSELESDLDHPDESEPEAEESAEPDEVDDDDVEADESEESEEEDDAEQDDAEPDIIDLGDEKVTREELKKRGLREADYTRKTQELAAKRKEVEAVEAAAREKLAQYEQRLELALSYRPKEPDWDKLREELTPDEFAQAFAEFELKNRQYRKVEEELARVQQEKAKDFEKQLEALKQEHAARLLEAIPEWRDDVKSRDEKQAVIDHAKQHLGVTDAEIAGLFDYRMWVALRDSMLLHRMRTQGKEKLREKVKKAPVLRPGVPTSPKLKGSKLIEQKRKRLARSGDVHDAAALIADFLDD